MVLTVPVACILHTCVDICNILGLACSKGAQTMVLLQHPWILLLCLLVLSVHFKRSARNLKETGQNTDKIKKWVQIVGYTSIIMTGFPLSHIQDNEYKLKAPIVHSSQELAQTRGAMIFEGVVLPHYDMPDNAQGYAIWRDSGNKKDRAFTKDKRWLFIQLNEGVVLAKPGYFEGINWESHTYDTRKRVGLKPGDKITVSGYKSSRGPKIRLTPESTLPKDGSIDHDSIEMNGPFIQPYRIIRGKPEDLARHVRLRQTLPNGLAFFIGLIALGNLYSAYFILKATKN